MRGGHLQATSANSWKLYLVAILALLAGMGRADDVLKPVNQYVHNVWRTEEGLPQNSVQVILQTRDGYLWLGTEEGLVRFNGVQFALFNKANTTAFLHNDVRSLMEDRDGNLWIGTFGGGVVKYRAGEFRAYTQKEGLSNNFVNALLQDRNGNIWIGTNNGLNKFHEGKFSRVGNDSELLNDTINALAEDQNGDIWLGTNRGVNQVHQSRFDSADVKASLPHNVIRMLYVDHSGIIWIGTDQQGLYAFNAGRLFHYGSAQNLPKAPILAIVQDEHGSLWVGTGGGGICRLDKVQPEARFNCYTSKQGLNGDSVLALFEDREKSIWAGTETGGLNRFKDGSMITYGAADGFNGTVRSIYEGRDGALWVALDSGLRRVKDRHVTSYLTPNGPANNYAWSVMEDRESNIWVGTNEGGINVFSKHGLKTYTTRDGLADDQVHAIFQDHAGTIWIGTERAGVSRFVNGKFTNYSTKDGLANNRVWSIFEDHDQNLWFATDGGLSRFDHGRFTNVALQEEPNSGTATGGAMYVYEDSEHVLWVGTYGGGLKRLANGKLTTYTTRNGLFDDSVWAILEDDHGSFWMSSNLGIFRVEKSELTAFAEGKIDRINSVSYGMSDGMLGTECNGGSQNAGWKTPAGTLLFACVRGIVAVTPGKLKSNPLPPPVVIEHALVNRRDVLHAKGTDAIGKADLEFDFAGLSYVAPEKVTFKYRLEGFDPDWESAGTRHVKYYTNIPAGWYTFRVVAFNNDGVESKEAASFRFYIQPHFYQTLPFYFGIGLGFIFFCVGAYLVRIRQLRNREKELVRLVDERTHDLQEQISERIRIEDELKATADIVASSHDSIWSCSMERVILTWNKGAERLLGYSAKEAIGQKFSILMLEENEGKVRQNQAKLLAGQRIPEFETVLLGKDGEPRYVSITLSPIYRQGKVVAVSVIARDIESRKRAEEALQNAKQAAEAATRAKSEFLANMSHEIRTPLNGVLGMIELVNGTTLTPDQKELLDMAQASANALLFIINDILDFSKIEAGKLQFNSEKFNLWNMITEAARTLAVRAHQKRLELVCRVAPDVPQLLLGDAHRLKQVLINLLGNAIKFTEQGEVVLRVDTDRHHGETAMLEFSVSDTGIGISAEQQQLIFKPFEQADASTTRRFGGTGLGLAISARIVSMFGGTLAVESEYGKGATFSFTARFPVVAQSIHPQQLYFPGLSALVLDDCRTSREVMGEILEGWGVKVTTADSAVSAMEEFHRAASTGSTFQFLLLDYRLAQMDGLAVVEQIQESTETRIPVVMMLTSDDYQISSQRCKESGITATVIKPVRPSELLAAIQAALCGEERESREPVMTDLAAGKRLCEQLSVLLAEDNAINQRLASRLLQKLGCSVVVAANGAAALRELEKHQFDLVLMDVQMPEMDGFAATRAIRQQEAKSGGHQPIIAMTAHAMQGDKELCLDAGMDGYISKPITLQALAEVIDSVLQQLGSRPELAAERYEITQRSALLS